MTKYLRAKTYFHAIKSVLKRTVKGPFSKGPFSKGQKPADQFDFK